MIALKVGKTAASAAKAVSHSGAIAGNHAAYAALFDRHNVIEVETLDDFANALRLYSGPRRLAAGDIATMHDSGGLLELTIDLAERRGVSFAAISDRDQGASSPSDWMPGWSRPIRSMPGGPARTTRRRWAT